ncbi:MAG TPA: helicase-associated domain-containing protein [Candidatus Tectomicrobia bacterium]
MPKGSLTVQPDGSLTVHKQPGEDTAALDAALSAFAELASATETRSTYQFTAASLWRARRHGLSLAEILRTLETYSQTEVPANVRADIERWSQQIERLTLEADQGRFFLRSDNPLVITAVRGHRTLSAFVTHQVDATTLELRADTYPEVVQAFDACHYPVLDRVQEGWNTIAPAAAASQGHDRRSAQTSTRQTRAGSSHGRSPPGAVPHPGAGIAMRPQEGAHPVDLVDVLRRHLPRQCQATTKAGRPCKNRARPSSPFCRVHADRTPERASLDTLTHHVDLASHVLDRLLQAGLVTLGQLAMIRTGILVGIGLCTWLLYALFMGVGVGWFHLPLAAWYTAGIAWLLTCWLLGRSMARIGLLASLHLLVFLLTSLLVDFLHKEGLILNLCFFLIPVVLPVALLYRYELSLWWGFLLFPSGLVIGKLLYTRLDKTSG